MSRVEPALSDLEPDIAQVTEALATEPKEASALAMRHAGLQLNACLRFLAIVRVLLLKAEQLLPNESLLWQIVVAGLLTKTVSTIRAAYALAVGANGREVVILVRSALESFATAAFVAKEDRDRRAERWV